MEEGALIQGKPGLEIEANVESGELLYLILVDCFDVVQLKSFRAEPSIDLEQIHFGKIRKGTVLTSD